MIDRAQEINGSPDLTVEDLGARLRSQFSAFPDQQLQMMLQCRHPSAEYSRFDREDIEQSIARRFQQQVAYFPNRLAVRTGSESLTYAGLNEAANRVAWQLLWAVPDVTRVGVLLDHGLSAVVGYLGVMKAGKVCVFLDRGGPRERARAIVENAGLGCIISDEGGLESLRELGFGSGQIVTIADCHRQPTANPDLEIRPSAPAEIAYTSGSTGLPKGIVHSHRNRLHKAWIVTNAFQICPDDRIALLHSLTSGPATTDIHEALLNGAALCSFDITRQDMSTLAAWLVDNAITIMHWVPSLFRHFGATLLAEVKFSSVRLVMLGSEQATTQDLELIKQHFSDSCVLVNRLGAIETANTRLFFANGRTKLPTGGLPVGYMLPDQRMILVNERGQPVPTGAIGEIVVCSEWLALEYYGQPDLTAAAFFTSPKDGARCFRTGDLGRLEPDGCLEYLGRADGRTKVRGRWVDTAKIETLLAEQPHLAECAVVAREEERSGSRLTAFLVPTAEARLSISELRSFLLQSIPSDALPSRFLTLARLPRMGTGKLDRRLLSLGTLAALREACGAVEELREAGKFVAPESELEESLTTIWEELFDVSPLGIHDSFFDLGGDSLLAMRLTLKVNLRFECGLSHRCIFSAPTIAQFARALELATTTEAFKPVSAAIRPRTAAQPLSLSFGQQRLWFLEQMEGELTAYNMPYALRLRGPLNTEALRRALEAMVRRHEVLRTTFAIVDGEPVQVIGTIERLELPVEDLRGLTTDQQAAEIMKRCRQEAERPFDLTDDLMLRASLLRPAEDEHVLLLTLHHIASDGWSMHVVFWRELRVLYDAFCRDAHAGLPDLPVQYADYALWQRKQLTGERLAGLLRYWREQLQGVSALELPTDHPRPRQPSYRGARHDFTLGPELIRQLQSLGQAEGVTLHMTLLAAFQVLLSRYSGQDDVAVGTPTAGRNHAALEDLIGFFVNALVLRTDLSGDPTFRELLSRVRHVSLAAYDHQDLPFEKLVEELQPERHLSRSPLVQVLFQLMSFSDQGLTLRDLEVSRLPDSSGRVRFDLEMHVWQPAARGDSLRATVVYSTDLFDAATIERMVVHFVTLLKGIAADADQRIHDLPLLTEAERQQLLAEWNDTAVEYPRDKCVHQLVEEQVERTPGAVAVVFEGEELTYRALNERANQLAHYLQSLGVGPETLVGLCLERSANLLIGILGILKAGGAYVPLDADHPPQRLEFMLRDSAVAYLVTERQLLRRLPVTMDRTVLLDRDELTFADLGTGNPQSDVGPHHVAYTMYTSGSTGHPKGVQILHSAVVNLLAAMAVQPGLRPDDRLLSVTTATFDISVLEFLLPLTVGARVEVLRSEVVSDAAGLAARLLTSAATVMQATPATWQMLIHGGWEGCRNLKVLCGGEALPDSLARELRSRCEELWNMCGPTETTIWSTTGQVKDNSISGSIGRPIANTQVYVLDRHSHLVPIGVPGELYIGGAGLARGYLNRPELTAEKFVPNPFSDDLDSRLYRTGDLCRWRADGNLEFLGRMDNQVKLRGFRIELGEIETVLNEHPSVAQSVVALREDSPGDKRLVAYYVSTGSAILDVTDLTRHMRARLPAYMVPSAFVLLEAFPLTPSGKISRRGLPAPDDSRPQLESVYAAPRNPIEEKLSSIWCDVMGIQSIGIHDDFFAQGGHSLLAVRLMARIESGFGKKLAVATLFEHPTIAHMARILQQTSRLTKQSALVKIQGEGPRLPLFFPPSLGGEAFFCKPMARHLGIDQPVWSFQVPEQDGVRKPFRDIETMAAFFVNELTESQMPGPYCLAGYSFGAAVALEMAQQLWARGDPVALLAIFDWGFRNPRPRTIGRLLSSTWASCRNLPYWLTDDFLHTPAKNMLSRLFGEIREIVHRVRHPWGPVQRISSGEDSWERALAPEYQALIETHHSALRQYRPRPYPGRITLFRARARALLSSGRERDLGWGRLARGGVDVRLIPGTHLTMIQEPFVQILAHEMQQALETANKDISRTT